MQFAVGVLQPGWHFVVEVGQGPLLQLRGGVGILRNQPRIADCSHTRLGPRLEARRVSKGFALGAPGVSKGPRPFLTPRPPPNRSPITVPLPRPLPPPRN